MNKAELDSIRLKIIRNISEIEDEEVLRNIGSYLAAIKCPSTEDYPYAPTKDELHSIIEQVLEDDRNGKFITTEQLMNELGL